MKRLVLLTALVALGAAAPAQAHSLPAPETTTFKRCGRDTPARCGTVAVPLDRPAATSAVRLYVRRIPARGSRRAPVVALAGGPGQAATPFAEYVADRFRRALRGREVITFDQRGTGRSGIIRCPTLEALGEHLLQVAGAAADCAETLGPRRAFYTTWDSVEDLEAVRRAVGAERVAVYGTSYGTKLALAYAAAYPQRVERLVLDSVVGTDGPDPFIRDSLKALPRVLRSLCDSRCGRITQDPAADLASLVSQLAKGLLRGPAVRGDGRPYPARLSRVRLLDLLFAGDFDPTLRAALPASIRSAVNGDPAPILRLLRRGTAEAYEPVSYFNPAVFAATGCEEGPLPWSRATPTGARVAEARALFDATPSGALGGFDPAGAFAASGAVQLCRLWPSAPAAPPILDGPFPDVPALLVSGEDDLRTPVETATAVARRLPRATVVAVPDVGHSALDWDNAGCARRALREFFADRPVLPCRSRPRSNPLEALAPSALSQLQPARGVPGDAGRTLTGVRRTLQDAGVQLEMALASAPVSAYRNGVPGLRGGRTKLKYFGLELERLEYVPGLKLTGELRGDSFSRGYVRIFGAAAAKGRLRLRRGILRGRLGGRRVRLPVPAELPRVEEQSGTIEIVIGFDRRRTPFGAGSLPLPPSASRR
jgi:pimeloyl-ACP methyl ester carboxylesterase